MCTKLYKHLHDSAVYVTMCSLSCPVYFKVTHFYNGPEAQKCVCVSLCMNTQGHIIPLVCCFPCPALSPLSTNFSDIPLYNLFFPDLGTYFCHCLFIREDSVFEGSLTISIGLPLYCCWGSTRNEGFHWLPGMS